MASFTLAAEGGSAIVESRWLASEYRTPVGRTLRVQVWSSRPGGEVVLVGDVFERASQQWGSLASPGGEWEDEAIDSSEPIPETRPVTEPTAVVAMLRKAGVRQCVYGHLHGEDQRLAVTGEREGIRFHLVASDAVAFAPALVLTTTESATGD